MQPSLKTSSAVQTHLTIMQGVIERMAENCRSCKLWCVTLVSAVLFFTVRSEDPEHALIALVPLVSLLFLDAYYLALERGFRASYDSVVRSLNSSTTTTGHVDLFAVERSGPNTLRRLPGCLISTSVLLFYAPLALTLLLVWCLVAR